MSASAPVPRPAPRPASKQVLGRRIGASLFAVSLLLATYLSLGPLQSGGRRIRSTSRFSHVYPSAPVPAGHQVVPGDLPVAPPANTIAGPRVLTSFSMLRTALPKG